MWGRGPLLVAATTAGTALALGGAAAAPASAAPRAHRDPAGDAGGAVDLVAARLRQQGPDVVLRLRAAARWGPGALAGPHTGGICLTVARAPRTGREEVCVSPHGAARRLRARVRRVRPDGSVGPQRRAGIGVSRPTRRALVLTIPVTTPGFAPGRLRWLLTSTAPRSRCAAATTGGSCTDTLPDGGSIVATVSPPLPTGCRSRSGLYTGGPAKGRRIALTFDDGPWYDTPQFLAVLEREHVPGTFFMIGRQVPGEGAVLHRMLADGDMIGNHSWSHPDLSGAGAFARSQLLGTQAAIRRASGFTPCLFRPPYGATSGALERLAGSLGLATILWDVDPRDWSRPGTDVIRARLLAGAHPGAILLMHDGGGDRSETLAQLPGLIRTLKARGYALVTVADLLGFRLTYG